jgi:hypothetical protein
MSESQHKVPESAQTAFRVMLRTLIAPELRVLGFKGSGNSFGMTEGDFKIGIHFQKDRHSTREAVAFDVNVSLSNWAVIDAFEAENKLAMALGKELESAHSGLFNIRLSKFGETQRPNFPWIVNASGSNSEIAADVLNSVRNYFLPAVAAEMQRPPPVPTPATSRAEGIGVSQASQNGWLERAQRIGVQTGRTLPETGT